MAVVKKIVVIASVALLLDEEEEETKKRRRRSIWTRPWLLRRKIDGAYHSLFKELKEEDSEGFKGYLRMDVDRFDELVHLLTPFLQKQDTNMRECIKPEEMCCIALRYLASGESFRSLEYQFRVSKKAISYIIQEVCAAIIDVLGKYHFKTPKTTEEWMEIAEKFYVGWNFPNGLGGVDGKHIVLQQPKNSGSHYRNYKGSDSIILMGMVGPEYEFLFADVGMNGRNSDGGNWSQSPLKLALESGALNLPEPTPLPGRPKKVPYVCTGDDAFPLSTFMMKPYPQKGLTSEKRVFNYRVSRMRRISENGFGILANRWRVFRRPFSLEPEKVKVIAIAAITLHNWLRKDSTYGKVYVSRDLVDNEDVMTGEITEGSWRKDPPTESWYSLSLNKASNATHEAKAIREEFREYFYNEGCVPWQWRCAF